MSLVKIFNTWRINYARYIMIDMHLHVGDGFLSPAQAMNLAQRAGYKAVALTLRGDVTIFDRLAPLRVACKQYSLYAGIDAFAAIELVHIPPQLMSESVGLAREAGAQVVLAHGESPVGLAVQGTNSAALLAGVDILAHPGNISEEDAAVAAENKVYLELTGASGHAVSNALVAARAFSQGCGLVFGSNARSLHDFYDAPTSMNFENALIRGACISSENVQRMRSNLQTFMRRLLLQ